MATRIITITDLKALSTAKLIELLSTQNVLVTSSGKQITLMSAVDQTYGNGTFGSPK